MIAGKALTGGEYSMAIEYEALAPGLACFAYLVFSVVVQGRVSAGGKTDQQGRPRRWVTQAEGPIFYVMMVLLFGALGVVLTLEGLGVL